MLIKILNDNQILPIIKYILKCGAALYRVYLLLEKNIKEVSFGWHVYNLILRIYNFIFSISSRQEHFLIKKKH